MTLLRLAKFVPTLRGQLFKSTASVRLTVPARFYGDAAGLTKPVIQERIFELLSNYEKVDRTKLTPDAAFIKDLKLDSLDVVEVVMAVEEEFSIEIPDHDADEIKSIKDAVEYITQRSDAV